MSAARLALSSLQNARSRAAAGQPTSPSLLRSSAVKRAAEGSPGAPPQGSPGFVMRPRHADLNSANGKLYMAFKRGLRD